MAAPSSWPTSRTPAAAKGLALYVLPPKRPQLNGAVERCNGSGDTSSTPSTTCRTASTSCSPSSTPSPTASTTQAARCSRRQNPSRVSLNLQPGAPRLICPEPGHFLAKTLDTANYPPFALSRASDEFGVSANTGGEQWQAISLQSACVQECMQ